MTGFFSKKETESKTRPDGKILSCISCGAYRLCNSPKLEVTGNFKKKILIISQSPEQIDDNTGQPFSGTIGSFLKKALRRHDIDMYEDCLLTYATKCRMPKDRPPTTIEVECCRKFVISIVETEKPKVIILLGQSALFSVIGNRWKKDLGNIEKWRGWSIPDQDLKAWICPVFHPLMIFQSKNTVLQTIFENDLKNAIEKVDTQFPIYVEPDIEIIEDLKDIHLADRYSAFDYETTGLKPHGEGHEIICCSIADTPNHVYVFMMPKKKKDRQPFLDYLADDTQRKIAQNMKFEHTWSAIILGIKVVGWEWDTMLATHSLDNRVGVSGLKFQTYVQLGIIDYSSEIEPYLKAVEEKNGNSANRIKELVALPGGAEKLMKYCAYDSVYEYRLAQIQLNIIKNDDLPF